MVTKRGNKVMMLTSLGIGCFVFILMLGVSSALEPFGATFSNVSTQRAPADSPMNYPAIAGNVTEINVQGFSTTQTWSGFYGNITGTIQLANGADYVLYNWTLASPRGEIYASTGSSVKWTTIQCFNMTGLGTDTGLCNTAQYAGATCDTGMNVDQLESLYGINAGDIDGVNETFALKGTQAQGKSFNHTRFYTNNLEFAEAECPSVHLFGSAGQTDSLFEEVLLYDPSANKPVFASLIDDSALGFDGRRYDFEMLVLEDGHGTNTASTTYYFYVELE